MQTRYAIALTALLIVPALSASAQFTAVVAPPPAQKQAVAMAAAKKAEVPRDTGRRATLQAMSAWVDSVAGSSAPAAIVIDSVGGDVVAAKDSVTPPVEKQGTTRFADGARAPNTASALPLVMIAGLGALLIGAWLVGAGRRPTPAVARRRAP